MPEATPPFFLVTIDTEGDNCWTPPRGPGGPETRNARFLPRFQELCERFGLKPCYLTAHEMANDPAFQAFGRDVLARGAGEIGMHLHAWDTPPHHDLGGLDNLGNRDHEHCPYLVEYPEDVMRQKITFMTALLEDVFQCPMLSHRAGRWAFDARYARLLLEHGYRLDCSVTPHVSWKNKPGAPSGSGGTDYTAFPEHPYILDPEDISCPLPPDNPGFQEGLLEAPMTIAPPLAQHQRLLRAACPVPLVRSVAYRVLRHAPRWLRPKPGNLREMLGLLQRAKRRGDLYVEFMLHSSELMPGGSPTFVHEPAIETLYVDLEKLFAAATAMGFHGASLAEFNTFFRTRHPIQEQASS